MSRAEVLWANCLGWMNWERMDYMGPVGRVSLASIVAQRHWLLKFGVDDVGELGSLLPFPRTSACYMDLDRHRAWEGRPHCHHQGKPLRLATQTMVGGGRALPSYQGAPTSLAPCGHRSPDKEKDCEQRRDFCL